MTKEKKRTMDAMAFYKERYGDAVSADYLAGVGSGVEWADKNPINSPPPTFTDDDFSSIEKLCALMDRRAEWFSRMGIDVKVD